MATVLILGSNRAESLEMSYSRAFSGLGWTVRMWNPAAAGAAAARGGRAGRLFSRFVQVEPWRRKGNVELVQLAAELRPDMILPVATEGLRAGSLAQAQVVSPGTRIFMAYPDSPHSLDAERVACLRSSDRVGVSSPGWKAAFEKLGASRATYLPFAADMQLYPPAQEKGAAPRWDVGFVGTWRPEREVLLQRMEAFRTRVWGGPYWGSRTAPKGAVRRMWAGHELVGPDFRAACAQTAIMLNILDPITWPGPNMRSFELPACGAFVLSTRTDAILEIFREGESIECFDSAAEAADKVRFYLQNPDSRARIARAAHELVVRGGHTYADRARAIAGWMLE